MSSAPETVQKSGKSGKTVKTGKTGKGDSGQDGRDKAGGDGKDKAGGKASLSRRIALRAGRVPRGRRIAIVVVLAVLVAGSGAASGLLAAQAASDQAVQADRAAATAAAKTEIQQILTYSYKTIAADMARARSDSTGQFLGEYNVMAAQTIGPQVKQQQTVTRAVVPVAAAVNSSGDQVTVVVFLDQSTTNKQQPKAQVNGSQLLVTMQKVNGRWLVEQFNPM